MTDNTRSQILRGAEELVNNRREHIYGAPEDNFRRAALLWEAYLRGRGLLNPTAKLAPHDVVLLLDLLKTSRLMHDHQFWDGWLDKAGYAAVGAEVAGSKPPPQVALAAVPSKENLGWHPSHTMIGGECELCCAVVFSEASKKPCPKAQRTEAPTGSGPSYSITTYPAHNSHNMRNKNHIARCADCNVAETDVAITKECNPIREGGKL